MVNKKKDWHDKKVKEHIKEIKRYWEKYTLNPPKNIIIGIKKGEIKCVHHLFLLGL